MKTIKNTLDYEIYKSKSFDMYFKDNNVAVFDIETTGLYPRSDKIILSGIVSFSPESSTTCVQYFADSMGDEKQVISKTVNTLSNADLIITYNGASFDMPFLQTRAKKYNIAVDRIDAVHLDIYNLVRYYSEIKKLIGSLKQKNLEQYMGVSDKRSDKISGAQSVFMYDEYLRTRNKDLERDILLHNNDDIIQLAKLIPVIEKTDFHRAISSVGFLAGDYVINSVEIVSSAVNISASHLKEPFNYISFPTDEQPCTILAASKSNRIDISIPTEIPAKGVHVIDAAKLLSAVSLEKLKKYPAFEAGYLIVKNGGFVNHLETNLFAKEFLCNLYI